MAGCCGLEGVVRIPLMAQNGQVYATLDALLLGMRELPCLLR